MHNERSLTPRTDEDTKGEFSGTAGSDAKQYNCFGKAWQFLVKWNTFTMWPNNSLLGVLPTNNKNMYTKTVHEHSQSFIHDSQTLGQQMFIKRWRERHTVAHPCDGTLVSTEKEGILTHNTHESQKCDATCKKPGRRVHSVIPHKRNSRRGKQSRMTESRSVIARVQGESHGKGACGNFLGNGNAPCFDCGGSQLVYAYLCQNSNAN